MAEVIITQFNLTTDSLRMTISGKFPSQTPPNSAGGLLFVNSNLLASPGFALGDHLMIVYDSTTRSFSGAQNLRNGGAVMTGNPSYGDYFFVWFENEFSPGEIIEGTLAADWNVPAFDPSQVTTLNVFWGADPSLPNHPINQPSVITGGTLLTTIIVPEPSSLSLLLAGGAVLMAGRRDKRK